MCIYDHGLDDAFFWVMSCFMVMVTLVNCRYVMLRQEMESTWKNYKQHVHTTKTTSTIFLPYYLVTLQNAQKHKIQEFFFKVLTLVLANSQLTLQFI
jgi:hypothetical protein